MHKTFWILFVFFYGCVQKKPAILESAPNLEDQGTFELDDAIYKTKNLNFESASGPNYLAMNVPFTAAYKIKLALEKSIGRKLKDRNEAHITVITPPEYDRMISPAVTMDEIKTLAETMQLQASTFRVVCLGRFRLTNDGQQKATYYLVVESEDLIRFREIIRDRIEHAVKETGQKPTESFDAHHYFPHITLGFTENDLHEQDGAIKNAASCFQQPQV